MFEYTEEEYSSIYQSIKKLCTDRFIPTSHPRAYILGGQPGAGKSSLQEFIICNDSNTFVINADAFRTHHPYYREIQSTFGDDSPKYTQPFINRITEQLISELSDEGYNLIIEGTLRTALVPLASCEILKEKGYNVSLYVISVKREISYESTILRYEFAKFENQISRAVAKEHHDMVCDAIVQNLDTIEKASIFDNIVLYTRSGECIYPSMRYFSAASAEDNIINGMWTESEKQQLKEIVNDIITLKKERKASDLAEYIEHANVILTNRNISRNGSHKSERDER